MEAPVKGDIVVVPFPFSNLADQKRRPALVVSSPAGNDVILCQITSKRPGDDLAVCITDEYSHECGLNRQSYIRPGKIFTMSRDSIVYKLGTLDSSLLGEVQARLIKLFLD